MEILIALGMVWPVGSDKWKAPLVTGFYCIFSLLIAGGKIPFPLRSWRESTLPTSILDIVDKLQYEVSQPYVFRYELKQ